MLSHCVCDSSNVIQCGRMQTCRRCLEDSWASDSAWWKSFSTHMQSSQSGKQIYWLVLFYRELSNFRPCPVFKRKHCFIIVSNRTNFYCHFLFISVYFCLHMSEINNSTFIDGPTKGRAKHKLLLILKYIRWTNVKKNFSKRDAMTLWGLVTI